MVRIWVVPNGSSNTCFTKRDNLTSKSQELSDIIAQMLQVFFRQMIAPQLNGMERRCGVNSPCSCVMMQFSQFLCLHKLLHGISYIGTNELHLLQRIFLIIALELIKGFVAFILLRNYCTPDNHFVPGRGSETPQSRGRVCHFRIL